MAKLNIPAGVRDAFEGYGFREDFTLDKALAVRKAKDWFGILFADEEKPGEFVAVDFCYMGGGEWDVQNDYIGPFASVEEFKSDPLHKSLLGIDLGPVEGE